MIRIKLVNIITTNNVGVAVLNGVLSAIDDTYNNYDFIITHYISVHNKLRVISVLTIKN